VGAQPKPVTAYETGVGPDIAESEGHHPDLHIAWGKCTVEIWTHKIRGLTESDFYFAAKADRAFKTTDKS
jgi:4a-hydroxytetrahydrobiopterin dehydratase